MLTRRRLVLVAAATLGVLLVAARLTARDVAEPPLTETASNHDGGHAEESVAASPPEASP